jgi:hypothetical protein
MTEVHERLLQQVMDGGPTDDDLIEAIAASPDEQAEAVRLAAILAELPGDGARAAEARLDSVLDAVSLVAVGHVVTATVTVT